MPTKYETLVLGVAAILGGLAVIWRSVRKLAATIDFWTALPSEHRSLVSGFEALTKAVAELTTEVAALRQAEIDRTPGRRRIR